jgi:hypothetical protein
VPDIVAIVCRIVPAGPLEHREELPHLTAAVEEWVFACWQGDGAVGLISGYRIDRRAGRPNWYWAALVRADHPLLHVADWHVPARTDPLLVKAPGLWAEHIIDAPMQQWTVTNETFATALDDPDEALGRGYGVPTPVAFDLEWYATAPPSRLDAGEPSESSSERTMWRGEPSESSSGRTMRRGYAQDGVVHGVVELAGGPLHLTEAPARRWHRWGEALAPIELPPAYAHTGQRAPFAFPDGTISDWVLTPDGWRARAPHP